MSLPVGITIIDNLISNCKEIINEIDESNHWSRSKTMENNITDYRTSYTTFVPLLSFNNSEAIHQMNKKVWEQLDIYAKKWNFSFFEIEDISIQKYQVGQKYDVHSDDGPNVRRTVSALLYLNTVKDGGTTFFPHFDFEVNAIEGRLIVFPSNYIYAHEAKPPISDVKYAAAYWAK